MSIECNIVKALSKRESKEGLSLTAPKSPSEKNVGKYVEPKDICFVIMPFGDWFDLYYKEIYAPAIVEADLDPHRADDLHRPGAIVNDIFIYTKQAKVILADLTTTNPNVLYELGLAHALTRPVIIVTDSLEQVPFDLRSLRIIEYSKSAPDWGDALKSRITKSIKETMKDSSKAVLPVFMEVDDTQKRKTISAHDKELMEIRQELELVKQRIYAVPSAHGQHPGLTLTPTRGTRGTAVVVAGSGWSASSTVTLTFGGLTLAGFLPDYQGIFIGRFQIPLDASIGVSSVVGTDRTGNTAATTFVVSRTFKSQS